MWHWQTDCYPHCSVFTVCNNYKAIVKDPKFPTHQLQNSPLVHSIHGSMQCIFVGGSQCVKKWTTSSQRIQTSPKTNFGIGRLNSNSICAISRRLVVDLLYSKSTTNLRLIAQMEFEYYGQRWRLWDTGVSTRTKESGFGDVTGIDSTHYDAIVRSHTAPLATLHWVRNRQLAITTRYWKRQIVRSSTILLCHLERLSLQLSTHSVAKC